MDKGCADVGVVAVLEEAAVDEVRTVVRWRSELRGSHYREELDW